MTAARGRANRRRGADAERAVVTWLRNNGFEDARRYLAGDGRQPGDIDGVPGVVIEVKDVSSSAWPTWRAQVLAEAGSRIPVVVRRTRGVTDVGQWDSEIPFHSWWVLTRRCCDPFTECKRTGQIWVRLPFYDVMDEMWRLTP